VLEDGRVLIAGGQADGTAELFDPVTGSFSLIPGKMSVPRAVHSAILLGDGSVLLAGGEENDAHGMESAEVFNPGAMTFSPTAAPMVLPRARPALRLLPDGKVQVVGGDYDGSIEIYDPAAGKFGAAAHLAPTADLFSAGEMLSAQTRAGFIDSISYRALKEERRLPERLKDRLSVFTAQNIGRSQYATADIPGSGQAVVVGGFDDGYNLMRSVVLVDSSAAFVTTDRVKYLPGEAPVITGAGFAPLEKVTIVRQEARVSRKRRTIEAVANEQGIIVSRDLKPSDYQVWTTYTLTARGEASGQVAQTSYRDAPMPGHEWEMLPKRFTLWAPVSNKDLSVESDTVLFKVTAKGGKSTTGGHAHRPRGGRVTPQDAGCSLPTLSTPNPFKVNVPFPSFATDPSAPVQVALLPSCVAFEGAITAVFSGPPNPLFSFKFDHAVAFHLALTETVNDTLPKIHFDIPIPDLSEEIKIGELGGTEFALELGLVVKISLEASVDKDAQMNPEAFSFTQCVDSREAYEFIWDTVNGSKNSKQIVFADGGTSRTTGAAAVTKLGSGSLKLSVGPALTVDVKVGGNDTHLGGSVGPSAFIEAHVNPIIQSDTCVKGHFGLDAGMDFDAGLDIGPFSIEFHVNLFTTPDFFSTDFTLLDTAGHWTAPNITQNTDPGKCTAVVNYDPNQAIAIDGCGSTIDKTTYVFDPPSGSVFPKGTTTVNCTATQHTVNLTNLDTNTCTLPGNGTDQKIVGTFTVTVVDREPPVITTPANITKSVDPNQCGTAVSYSATATDNCDVVTPTCTPKSGSFFPFGMTNVNCTATDTSGNTGTASFMVNITDDFTPVFAPHPTIAAPIASGQACGIGNYTPPVASDPCGAKVVCVPPPGSCFPQGVTKVMCTATNPSNHQGFTSFNVIGTDTCLQNDLNFDLLQWSSVTGDYLFTHCGSFTPAFTMPGKGVPTLIGFMRMLNDTKSDRQIRALYMTNQFTGHASVVLIFGGGLTQNYFINQTNPHPTCVCPQATAALIGPPLQDGARREDSRSGSSPGASPAGLLGLVPRKWRTEPHSRQGLG
jgi:hypothetical protein